MLFLNCFCWRKVMVLERLQQQTSVNDSLVCSSHWNKWLRSKKYICITHLVIFHSQIVSRLFQMCYLHEISGQHRFPYVEIVVPAVEIRTAQLQVESGHNANKLLPYVICRLQCSLVDKILITPVWVLLCYMTIGDSEQGHPRIKKKHQKDMKCL